MGLKHVHIFFILASLALCSFLIYWAVQEDSTALLACGVLGDVAGTAYLVWFLKKVKSI